MLHTISTRGKFFIAALLFFLIAIILVLILPIAVMETVYDRQEYIFLAMPFSNIKFFAICLFGIFCSMLLLAFKQAWYTVTLTVVITVASIFISYHALTGYIAIQNKDLTVKDLWHEHQIEWEHVNEINFEYTASNAGNFIFEMKDGSIFILPYSGNIGSRGKSIIYSKSVEFNIPFAEYEKL